MNISYLSTSNFRTGVTSKLIFATLPVTVTPDFTMIAFVMARDIGLSPIFSEEWTKIETLETPSISATTYCFINVPTGTTVNPTYYIGGLSNRLNAGFVMYFSGCTYDKTLNKTRVIDAKTSMYHPSATSTTGFTTSTKNTVIVRGVAMVDDVNVDSWSSTPSLTFTETIDTGKTSGVWIIHLAGAYSENAPKDNYTLSYTLHVGDTPSISVDVALTPKIPNKILAIHAL
jgi:hypothetical protein